MEQTTSKKGEQFLKKHRKWKRWQKIVSAMACVVVFCTTYALILPAITLEKNVYCDHEEHKEHTKSCYSEVSELVCNLEESNGHKHSDKCYEEILKLVCNKEESEGHKHQDACYEERNNLVCGKEEQEGHAHSASCYGEDGSLICGKEETSGHSHSKECYVTEKVLICGKAEEADHKHSDSCYEKEHELVCKKQESEKHKHTKDCYKTEKTLICKKPIHEHTKICYSNPKADLETKKDWEKTLQKVELTGKWQDDVIEIAKSQLGYHESKSNYIVDNAGKTKGYTRYGEWYGDSYGHWCAMFVSFCLNYADVDQKLIPYSANCQRWIETLQKEEYQLYHPHWDENEQMYIPKVGDLVYFDWDHYDKAKNRKSDHIGLVAELITNKKGELTSIRTIEGNSSDKVEYVKYAADDDRILGYGELPENPNYDEEAPEVNESASESESFLPEGSQETSSEDDNPKATGQTDESQPEKISDELEGQPEKNPGELESQPEKTLDELEGQSEETMTGEENQTDEALSETEDQPGEILTEEETLEGEPQTGEDPLETELPSEEESSSEEEPDKDQRIEKSFEADDYIVTAYYTEAAGLPENVILTAREIPANSEEYENYYSQAVKALNAQNGEAQDQAAAQIAFARFFDITFTYDEQEIEPFAPVDVVITYKDAVNLANTENAAVVHFAEDGIELLDVEITKSGETSDTAKGDNKLVDTFTFTQESFSVTGTLVTSNKIPMNQPIVIFAYISETNKFYALAKDGNAVEIQTGATDNTQIIIPEGRDDILWEYTNYLISDKLCIRNMEDEGYMTLTASGVGSSVNESGIRYSYVAGSNGEYDSWRFYSSSTNILGRTTNRYLSFDGSKFTTNTSDSQAALIYIASDFVFSQPDPIDPVDPVDPEEQAVVEAKYEHHKTIDYLGDGVKNVNTDLLMEDLYRLNLDMTGIRKPVDLLLVVDASGSMKRLNNGGTTQGMTEIIKFLNGNTTDTYGYNPNITDFTTASCDGFIHEFFQLNNLNRLAIVAFGGADSANKDWIGNSSNPNYRYTNDAWLIKDWNQIGQTYNSVPVATNYYPDGRYRSNQIGLYIENNVANNSNRWIQGTNYSAGLMRAQDEFDKLGADDGERIRIMVFLSDGQPTYSIVPTSNSQYPTYHDIRYVRRGQGQERYYDDRDYSIKEGTAGTTPGVNDCYYDSEQSFNLYQSAHPEVVNYAIAFKVSTAETQVLKYIGSTDKNRSNGKNFQTAENHRDLQNTILGVFQPRNVAIKDTLSAYVDFYEEQPDVKVTMTPKGGGNPVVLWEGYNPGHATAANTYTYTYYDSNNRLQTQQRQMVTGVTYQDGTIIAQFDDKFAMPQTDTFALSFNVQATDYAYDTYAVKGYDQEGDAGTDFASNTTSSLKPGFYSNAEATVSYTNGDDSQSSAPYDDPVVQVDKCELLIKKTDPDGKPLADAVFTLKKKDGTVVGNFIVDDNGQVLIPSKVLTTGEYILEETQAPEGCLPAKGNVSFNVDRGMIFYDPPEEENEWIWGSSDLKNVQMGPDGNSYPKSNRYQYDLRIVNTIHQVEILLQKTDSTYRPLADASFSLYKDANLTEAPEKLPEGLFKKTFTIDGTEKVCIVSEVGTNLKSADKTVTIDGEDRTVSGAIYHGELREGLYYLVEDKSPNGYNTLTEPVLINITSEGVTYTYRGNQITKRVPDMPDDEIDSIQVINTDGYLLPATGGPGTKLYTIGGVFMMITASLLYGFKLRRKRERRYS